MLIVQSLAIGILTTFFIIEQHLENINPLKTVPIISSKVPRNFFEKPLYYLEKHPKKTIATLFCSAVTATVIFDKIQYYYYKNKFKNSIRKYKTLIKNDPTSSSTITQLCQDNNHPLINSFFDYFYYKDKIVIKNTLYGIYVMEMGISNKKLDENTEIKDFFARYNLNNKKNQPPVINPLLKNN